VLRFEGSNPTPRTKALKILKQIHGGEPVMSVKFLEFSKLKKTLDEKNIGYLDFFVKKFGKAYVVLVTREKCSGCERQKGLFEKTSDKMKSKHGARVEFFQVHAYYTPASKEETLLCLDTFRTVAFPTYVICLRDHRGNNRETYRAVGASMSEIEKNIESSVELAKWFEQKKNEYCQKKITCGKFSCSQGSGKPEHGQEVWCCPGVPAAVRVVSLCADPMR